MNMLNEYRRWRIYRETLFSLRNLSDHSLADIGIERENIRRIARQPR